jgi:hypothetical protein
MYERLMGPEGSRRRNITALAVSLAIGAVALAVMVAAYPLH